MFAEEYREKYFTPYSTLESTRKIDAHLIQKIDNNRVYFDYREDILALYDKIKYSKGTIRHVE